MSFRACPSCGAHGGGHFGNCPIVRAMRVRPPDPARVATRPFELSEAQREVVDRLYVGIGETCQTPEDGVAVIVYALSEFLLKMAKPNSIPEAVATVIECLRINMASTDGT